MPFLKCLWLCINRCTVSYKKYAIKQINNLLTLIHGHWIILNFIIHTQPAFYDCLRQFNISVSSRCLFLCLLKVHEPLVPKCLWLLLEIYNKTGQMEDIHRSQTHSSLIGYTDREQSWDNTACQSSPVLKILLFVCIQGFESFLWHSDEAKHLLRFENIVRFNFLTFNYLNDYNKQ